MKTSDVMTQEVISVPPTATLNDAVDLMLTNGISGLPVIDERGALVGIVTEGDLLRRAELGTVKQRARWIEFLMSPSRLTSEYIHSRSRKVAEVMSTSVYSITEDTPLEDAVTMMETRRIKRLPVVRSGRVVGILSRANLLRALAALRPTDAGHVDDAKIRVAILKEIETHLGTIGVCDVIVKDGVVDLWGSVYSNRDALRVAAENVGGVKQVRNHLTWIDPMSGFVIESGEGETAGDQMERALQTTFH